MPAEPRHFGPELFAFLADLKANNDRSWFQANKGRWEDEVQHPALQFISDFGPRLREISRHFRADPRPSGGSLFRIYRDTRFSHDKSPYKTHVGIHFRHTRAADAHAPGFYLHLEPGQSFVGLGIWRPDGPSLAKLRGALVANPRGWEKVRDDGAFRAALELSGDALKRPPKGFPPDHPLVEDLKRTDFVAVAKVSQAEITGAGFLDRFAILCAAGGPFVAWLCRALEVEY